MRMASNTVINGFQTDVNILLKRFVKRNSTSFKCFAVEWRRMDFQYVFFGYSSPTEMVQFLEDVFIVLKYTLLNANSSLEQIGAVYLMYAMYFKQPTKQYCKFRVTMDEWIKINQFYNEMYVVHVQVSLVFWKLLQGDAFRFVEAEHEYGFERFMQKGMSKVDDENQFMKVDPLIESTIHCLRNKETGIIPALEILQVGYNEMKEHLNGSSSNSGILPATSITSDILDGLGRLKSLFMINIDDEVGEENTDPVTSSANALKPTKREIKRKGFGLGNTQTAESTSRNKATSMKYRGTVLDDGEFIRIQRPSHIKARKLMPHLSERQVKTVAKQLDAPFDGESELALPTANPSTSTTKIKCENADG